MDKQRKSALSFFYNSVEGNRTPQVEIMTKVKKTTTWLWGLSKPKVQDHQEVEKAVIVKEEEQVKQLVDERKSVSHVETNMTSVISFLHLKVLAVDMPGYMQVHAFRCARRTYDSLEKFSSKHMAFNIKKVGF
ncbi:Dynein light chain type 1 family protein [Thalictrum thalictroides]|uniref:Dynein light chain type 1 family protein n=1 Tax=Thalictrum thalictroides TaxID=46969 RepID=A0A7J6XBM0_THATH|nr:Dynein light chain type 1 family protein [Thalictrum thalictroides]